MSIDEILNKVPDKGSEIMTTSKTQKRHVYEFFHTPYFADKIAVEFGCYHCHSTIVLAQCFKQVFCLDNWEDAINKAHAFLDSNGITNVTIFQQDLYNGTPLPINGGDVILIDSKHTYDGVKEDIDRFLKFKSQGKKFFILDDYRICPEIQRCVNDFTSANVLKVEKYIGTFEGQAQPETANWEAVILSEV